MDKLQLVLPPGRFISGSLTEIQTTDHENKPIPEEKYNIYFGVAVRKDDPNIGNIMGQLFQMASAGYQTQPQIMQAIQMGIAGPFAWKISDGDVPNSKGELNEHAAGCYVFSFKTGAKYPPKACNEQNVQIDPNEINRGDYVDVAFSSSINGATGAQAGIYLNPNIVRRLGYGERIISGPTPDQAFGNAPAQLPPGASPTPVASTGMPAQQPMQQPQGMPAQQPQGMPAQQPQVHQFTQPAANPGTMGAPPPNNAGMPAGNAPTGMPAAPAASPGFPAPTGAPSGQPATQYPSNVQPHTGFPNGPQQ